MSSLDLSAFAMIDDLLQTAQANDFTNRRTNPRFPFFQPVSVSPGRDGQQRFSAFARDIAEAGIGLLHHMPLSPGEARVFINTPAGGCEVPVDIAWCRSAGDGWYMSGAKFLRVAD